MTDRMIRVDDERVEPSAVTNARLIPSGRDTPPLVAALASLLLAVLVPTFAIAVGIDFVTVVPIGVVLFLFTPVGLVVWLRSGTQVLVVETEEATYRERLDEEDTARAERIVEQHGR